MKNKLGKTIAAVVFAIIVVGAGQTASAQNMSDSVVTKQVRFAKGKHSTVIKGSAKYAMSYVYDLRAKEGQTMTISLEGKNSELSFSVIAPDEETMEDGFSVTEWTGELPQSGKYSIVVVMNDEDAKSAALFTLRVEIK